MGSMDLTREWLQTVLRPYTARDRLVGEVVDVLTNRRTLAVKTDAFTFDNGSTSLLLLLHGTLPISFRGATYHIPINVWIPHDYPRAPPLAFVVPTKDMGVRKGKEVEPGGRVKEDAVALWWNSWPDKSVEILLRQLIAVFSNAPPVYAKPPETVSQAPSSAGPSRYTSPPPPPTRPNEMLPQYRPATPTGPHSGFVPGHMRQSSLPSEYQSPPRSPIGSGTGANGHPPVPPRPTPGPSRQGSQPPASPGGSSNAAPVIPARPYVQVPAQIGHPPASPAGQGPPPRPVSVGQPYLQSVQQGYNQPYQPPVPFSNDRGPIAGGADPQPMYHQTPPALQHQPAQSQSFANPPAPVGPTPVQHSRAVDLLSETDDDLNSSPVPTSAPPIPPSKPPPPSTLHLHAILLPHLQASLPPLLQQLHSTKIHLQERQADLQSGEPAIKDEMARLQAVKKVCDSTGRKMDDVVSNGSARVADLEQRGEVSVDEVVCGISIVHNQLIDLVAEDNALEDTIYHVTRALEAERIDLDRFLKSIRSLAREQYTKRALIERILQGMGQKQW